MLSSETALLLELIALSDLMASDLRSYSIAGKESGSSMLFTDALLDKQRQVHEKTRRYLASH